MPTLTRTAIALRGTGLHSGLPGCVRLIRREAAGGPRFFWLDRSEPTIPESLADFSRRASRSTLLQSGELEIRTMEHLLAASIFFVDCPVDVHCDSREPPGLDGSALPYHQAFAELFPEKAGVPSWRQYRSNLRFAHEGPEGTLKVEPAPAFSIEYELHRPPLAQFFRLDNPGDAVGEILSARTFIFSHEWDEAIKNGLLRGCTPDSGMLYASTEKEFALAKNRHAGLTGKHFPLLHPETERVEQEAVKHKILDLLGDLALLGLSLPRLSLRIRNGGHALNHLLLERLQHERKPSGL